jgi:hypothetical protein
MLARAAKQIAPIQQDYFAFGGGLDLVTPPIQLKPGMVRDGALNFECGVNGGYTRIKGYERYSGKPRPSDATYYTLPAGITLPCNTGDTLTGLTSGATGVVIALPGGKFVLTKVTGTFQVSESLQVAAVTVATAAAVATLRGETDLSLDAQYRNLAADQYRNDIATITGSGSILGVKAYNDVVYAFRANAGATAVNMWKSTATGWSQIVFDEEISFTAGNTGLAEGATLTQGGVTSTIKRLIITSGTLAGGTAAGRMVIRSRAGGNYAAGAATGTGAVTLSGVQTAITLATGGRFEFRVFNFGGSAGTKRMYGCDGANRGFEFDSTGDVFAPITTGMAVDKPSMIEVHKNQLFFMFGASVQHAAPGTPFIWSAVLGASEIALGDSGTNMLSMPGGDAGGAMLLSTRNRLFVLYGAGVSSWNLVTYSFEAGAFAYSAQQVGLALLLDDRGITSLQNTASWGNFDQASLSRLIKPWLNTRKTLILGSTIAREKNQYRLFFSDSYALYVTMAGPKVMGMMPILLSHVVKCVTSDEFSDGSERSFFGSTDGYVYEMERGTSFDGGAITFSLSPAFNHEKSPRTRKHYRTAVVEVTGSGYAEFQFSYSLGYGSNLIPSPDTQTAAPFGTASTLPLPQVLRIDGSAENISPTFSGSSDYFDAFTLNSASLNYTPRRVEHGGPSLIAPAVASTPTLLTVDAAVFDGTNDYLTKAAGFTGAVDSKKGIFSAWIRLDGSDGSFLGILSSESNRASCYRFLNNKFQLAIQNTVPADSLILTSVGTYLSGTTWLHVLWSWDTAVVGARHLYVNNVSDLNPLGFVNEVLDYTLASWTIGSNTGGSSRMNGCLAEVYFAPGQYLDLSVSANREKFIYGGKPVSLGTDGSIPTGIMPIVYLHLDHGEAPANFALNRGSGGNFTVTGALTTASTSPSD